MAAMTDVRLLLESLDCGILQGVDLALAAGECLGLAGASGSGKSRLLRAIADLDPNGGEAYLDGQPRSAFKPSGWRRQVAMLSAESHWWGERVGEHLTAAPDELAALALPADVLEWPVGRLSSGERQRLALLRLLPQTPKVLLLDEPTANLDQSNTQRVEHWLTQQRRCQGLSLLWVSHDEAQLRRVADRAVLIRAGRLVPLWT